MERIAPVPNMAMFLSALPKGRQNALVLVKSLLCYINSFFHAVKNYILLF